LHLRAASFRRSAATFCAGFQRLLQEFEADMSRKTIFLLAGLYLAAAFAFGIFRVVSSPFFAGLTVTSLGKSIGSSLLLFGAAGLLPILAWSFQRFDLRYALWPMLTWAFIGIALAYFLEIGIRVERDVQVSTLARNLAQSDAKLSCLDTQRANKFIARSASRTGRYRSIAAVSPSLPPPRSRPMN